MWQPGWKYKKFYVAAGLGDISSTDGSATFTVQVDNKTPSAVTLGVGQDPHRFEMDLTGAFRISLSVKSNGCATETNATAVWIEPTLEL
ncbi:MAG: NPCBM/NEW2 domain-containing protein [Actinomycetota bacterium]|nr:NPCBM/NEW2 domain-containing protein [Actinomycetota bacterium]